MDTGAESVTGAFWGPGEMGEGMAILRMSQEDTNLLLTSWDIQVLEQ